MSVSSSMLAVALAFVVGQTPSAQLPPMVRVTNIVNAYGAWSPDGRRIVYQSNPGGNFDLYVMNADGTGVRSLIQNPAHDITPVWSPDGKRITFVSERTGNRDVYVCDGEGRGLRNLTRRAGNDIHPVWSADGRQIMFSSNRGNASPDDFDIYVMDHNGRNVRRLTSGPDVDTYASWSPDGKRIVTRRVVGGNNEVFVMDADGSNVRNLTNSPDYDGWPVWSPDGKWIVYASGPADGEHKIFRIRPDGTGREELTHSLPAPMIVYDTQPAVAPDGRRIVFTRYRMGIAESADLVVMTLPER